MLALLLADLKFALGEDLRVSQNERQSISRTSRRRCAREAIESCACQEGRIAHLLDDLVLLQFAERLAELVRLGGLAFRDIGEDAFDLKHLVEVGLNAGPPLLDLVLVAGNLYQEP